MFSSDHKSIFAYIPSIIISIHENFCVKESTLFILHGMVQKIFRLNFP